MSTRQTTRGGTRDYKYQSAPLPNIESQAQAHGRSTIATYEVSGIERKEKLQQMFWISVAIIAVSIVAMVVGSLAMSENSEFPYIANSAGLAGLFCLISALLTICLVQMGRKADTYGDLPKGFKSMFCCSIVTLSFSWFFILLALGIGGVWGTIECVRTIKSQNILHLCKGDAHKLFALSVITLVLMCIIAILMFVLHCMYCHSQLGLRSDQYILKASQTENATQTEIGRQDGVMRLKDYSGPSSSVARDIRSYHDDMHDKQLRNQRSGHRNHLKSHRAPYDEYDDNDRQIHDGRQIHRQHTRDHDQYRDSHSSGYRFVHEDHSTNDRLASRSHSDHCVSHSERSGHQKYDTHGSFMDRQSHSIGRKYRHNDYRYDHRSDEDDNRYTDQRSSHAGRSSNKKKSYSDRNSYHTPRSDHRDQSQIGKHHFSDYRSADDHKIRVPSVARSHHSKRHTASSLDDRPPSYREVVKMSH